MTLDQLHIHEEAMNQDISRLRDARADLDAAKTSVTQLKNNAEGMQGKTGQAIVQKANEMISKINSLDLNLDGAISAINRAKQEYAELERELIQKINNS